MFDIEFKDINNVVVAVGFATLNGTVDFHFSVKDRVAYEKDKNNIDRQEENFRARVLQAADIMGIASTLG